MVFQYLESTLNIIVVATSDKPHTRLQAFRFLLCTLSTLPYACILLVGQSTECVSILILQLAKHGMISDAINR